jgi:hypothetical protein
MPRRRSWRYDPAGLFSARHWGIPFKDAIPDLPEQPRRDEILAWLTEHPEVTRFAVIDNDDDELDELPLFQPSPATGLSEEIAQGVADFLSGKTDRDMRRSRPQRLIQNLLAVLRGHPG